ncbi:hypothetical protein VIGAN_04271300 [Vigna angularis var. angularis]|uniref:Uncharacterized protein n=1 Tax=Vigna angularis var. angularis TaxID=157739 RepID=A0A0S3RX74_PHAAN|nr:hypothetical protein VIGAN_04271300 [Vigna angularis var. angularis]
MFAHPGGVVTGTLISCHPRISFSLLPGILAATATGDCITTSASKLPRHHLFRGAAAFPSSSSLPVAAKDTVSAIIVATDPAGCHLQNRPAIAIEIATASSISSAPLATGNPGRHLLFFAREGETLLRESPPRRARPPRRPGLRLASPVVARVASGHYLDVSFSSSRASRNTSSSSSLL